MQILITIILTITLNRMNIITIFLEQDLIGQMYVTSDYHSAQLIQSFRFTLFKIEYGFLNYSGRVSMR